MDIGLLFDMENLDRTISPASFSTHDLAALLSDSSPVSRAHLSPRNVRTQMQSTPSFKSLRHEPILWPSSASPMSVRSWQPEDDLQYPSLQESSMTSTVRPSPSTILPKHYTSSLMTTQINPLPTRPSQTLSANIATSPARDDISWQMYISSSLSLDFCDARSSASHPLDDYIGLAAPDSFSLPPAPFPSSMSSNSLPTTIDPTLFLQLDSQAASSLSRSRAPSFSRSPDKTAFSSANDTMQMPPFLPDGTYAPPVARPMNLDASSLPVSILAASRNSPSLSGPQMVIAQPKPSPARPGQGICGWSGGTNLLRVPSPTIRPKRRRTSSSDSPAVGAKRRAKASPLSSTASDAPALMRSSKRSRRSAGSNFNRSSAFDFDDQDDFHDDGDSDDYCPSRSASPDYSSQRAGFAEDGSSKAVILPRKVRRGTGKAKGSAALALALVTQMGNHERSGSELPEEMGVNVEDALALYQEGRIGIRKRKNHPIPLPVPVPELNKKSRGRKVPFVADLSGANSPALSARSGSSGPKEEDGSGGGSGYNTGLDTFSTSSSGRGSRRRTLGSNRSTPLPDDGSGPRSFVCVVAGCGKCFVRGEHLKRHVRSIHTNDKPHQCPYEGCDKSFSRRDNLGQHVRIHLQP